MNVTPPPRLVSPHGPGLAASCRLAAMARQAQAAQPLVAGERMAPGTDRAHVVNVVSMGQHARRVAVLAKGFEAKVLFA